MAQIRAEAVFKDAGIKAHLSGLGKRTKELDEKDRKVIAIMSAIVFRDIMDHFNKQEGPDGPWKPWSDSYRKHMWQIGKHGNKILQDSGRLRQSFTMSNYRSNNEGVTWYNAARTKSGFPYAWAHDNDEEPRTKLPRRAFMWLSDKAVEDIESALLRFLEG